MIAKFFKWKHRNNNYSNHKCEESGHEENCDHRCQ